jgi:Transposase DDE domain group 1
LEVLDPIGEKQNQPFQLSFNSSLKVDFQGSRVTSDGALLLVRELDERLGLSELIREHLSDGRRGKNTRLPLSGFQLHARCSLVVKTGP